MFANVNVLNQFFNNVESKFRTVLGLEIVDMKSKSWLIYYIMNIMIPLAFASIIGLPFVRTALNLICTPASEHGTASETMHPSANL